MGTAAVFGSTIVDMMARGPHLPTPGETVKGSYFRMGPGGKGFNQCVAAHKAGCDVTMVGKVGRDALSAVHLGLMEELGMDRSHMIQTDDAPTGTALVAVDENTGQNQILIAAGANSTFTREEVEGCRPLLERSSHVLLQLEVNQDANEAVCDLARACGCRVILNPAPSMPLDEGFVSKLWMVTPNEVEARDLCGVEVRDLESGRRAAAWFHDRGVEVVVVTLGSTGVFASCGGRAEIVPANRVEAVDTTGAGDAFNGGLLAALSEGADVWEALRFANALAALSVQRMGAAVAMPTRAEVDAFLAKVG